MKTPKPQAWISYYLYHTVPADELLVGTMWPLVQGLTEEQLTRQFFFIRYGDSRGPHIRLRLLPSEVHARRTVMQRVKKVFPDAKFVTYIPETERYGGPAGVPIAERLFQASSLSVLQLLTGARSWNYNRAQASALQMHVGMLQAFGVSRAEAIALLMHIAQSPRSPAKDTARFEAGFISQREMVAAPLAGLWAACEQSTAFSDQWFGNWRDSMQKIGDELLSSYKDGHFLLPDSSRHDHPLWFLYESYIHMTNNRLGVRPADESFGAYMLARSLE